MRKRPYELEHLDKLTGMSETVLRSPLSVHSPLVTCCLHLELRLRPLTESETV